MVRGRRRRPGHAAGRASRVGQVPARDRAGPRRDRRRSGGPGCVCRGARPASTPPSAAAGDGRRCLVVVDDADTEPAADVAALVRHVRTDRPGRDAGAGAAGGPRRRGLHRRAGPATPTRCGPRRGGAHPVGSGWRRGPAPVLRPRRARLPAPRPHRAAAAVGAAGAGAGRRRRGDDGVDPDPGGARGPRRRPDHRAGDAHRRARPACRRGGRPGAPPVGGQPGRPALAGRAAARPAGAGGSRAVPAAAPPADDRGRGGRVAAAAPVPRPRRGPAAQHRRLGPSPLPRDSSPPGTGAWLDPTSGSAARRPCSPPPSTPAMRACSTRSTWPAPRRPTRAS